MNAESENDLIAQRRQDLDELRKAGNAYNNQFKRDSLALDLHVTSHRECQQHPRVQARRRQRRLTVQRCPEVVLVEYQLLRRRHRRRRCRG